MVLKNSELYDLRSSGTGEQFSVKGHTLDILGFEGHVDSVDTLKVSVFPLACVYGCVRYSGNLLQTKG